MDKDPQATGSLFRMKRLPLLIALAAVIALNVKPVVWEVSYQNPGAFHHDMLWGGPATISIMRDLWSTGHPPLWTPYMVTGAPYLGHYLPSVAHPFSILLYRFEAGKSAALASLISALLTVLFGYALFRECGASAWASSATAFLAAMTGFYPWVSYVYCIGYTLPWLLLWMWSAMRLTSRPGWRPWLWNALAGAMILLGGDAQLTVEGAYLLPAWYLIFALRSRVPFKRLAAALALLALAAVLGFLIDSVQMLPAILYFSRAVAARKPDVGAYVSTFPPIRDSALAAVLLFSRRLEDLFLPLSVPLFILAAAIHRRKNPAFFAALVVSAATAFIVIGGRSGLAAIPFHLPMLKMFFRHYKLAVLLQGPVFIGAALGFDAVLEKIKSSRLPWLPLIAAATAASLAVLPDNPSRALVLAAAALFFAASLRGRHHIAPAALFFLIIIDAGVQAWPAPFDIRHPQPDPVYLEYVTKAAGQGREQGMFPWTTLATSAVNRPLPVHGTGYFGEYSIDSWLEYPLRNYAYFLAAIRPEVAHIEDGVFSRVDFATPFKSTDFVTPQNRRLINLVALRWFLLQDMALAEADVFPLLCDTGYAANPSRPQAFAPLRKINCAVNPCPASLPPDRPALEADDPGAFHYQRDFREGDALSTRLVWGEGTEVAAAVWETGPAGKRLLFARAVGRENGEAKFFRPLSSGPGDLAFARMPLGGGSAAEPELYFADPRIENPSRTIHYRAGNRVMAFENIEAFGRGRIVHQARHAGGNQEAMEIMRDPGRYDPESETLLMDPDAPAMDGPPPAAEETAEITVNRLDHLTVRANLAGAGYLVLSEAQYPGWRAFTGGREVRIHRADINFRAVELGPGEHLVRFVYLPDDFRVGLFASLACLLALAAAWAWAGFDRKRHLN